VGNRRPTGCPWVRCSSPAQANQEEYSASDEEEDSYKVEFLELLPLSLSRDVELVVGRRVVKELIQNDSDARQDDAEVVRPAPSSCCFQDECSSDDRSENCVLLAHWSWRGSGRVLPANGMDEKKTNVTIGPLCLFGTSSPSTIPNESCPAAAIPFIKFAPTRVSMLCAVPPTMQPHSPNTFVPMTIHFLPKMSDKRPTRRKPIALPIVQIVATQLRSLEGPMSSLIKALNRCQN